MKKALVSAIALSALAGAAHAQVGVEYRIVQVGTTNQGPTNVAQNAPPQVFNFAVQARVVGGTSNQFIGDFGFNVRAIGENDTNGVLQYLRINNPDEDSNFDPQYPSYWTGAAATNGITGMQYAYRALIASVPTSNGVINGSFGSIVHVPTNTEILGISGRLQGSFLVAATDTNPVLPRTPDNATNGNNNGSTAVVDPAIATAYFGAGGTWADLYRFRYTLNNTAALRSVNFQISFNASTGLATSLQNNLGVWGVVTEGVTPTSQGYTINIVPAPATAALLGLGGLVATRRRRA